MAIGLKRGIVALFAYDPLWKEEFEREVFRLKSILPENVGPFEHIGSTAIPGIPAKPIIDFMIGLPDVRAALTFKDVLEKAGYAHRPIDDNAERVFFVRGTEDCRTHHLSFVTLGSSQWNNALGFRDVLRDEPSLAARYVALKRELEARYPEDRPTYTKEKEPFFKEVFEILATKSNTCK